MKETYWICFESIFLQKCKCGTTLRGEYGGLVSIMHLSARSR